MMQDLSESNFLSSSNATLPELKWLPFPLEDVEFTLYTRVSQEQDILRRAQKMIGQANEELSKFTPSLVVIVTWHSDFSNITGMPVKSTPAACVILMSLINIHSCSPSPTPSGNFADSFDY